MKGKYKIVIKNNRLHYELEIKRNITIIKGDSATGKTTLIDMVRQFSNFGNSSGIEIISDVSCRVVEGVDWKILVQNIARSIIFIDEENAFIRTKEFAEQVKQSDNYFVLVTRENLYNLPYSVEEIYGLYSSGKYQNTKKVYQHFYRIYTDSLLKTKVRPDKIITEDTNSGYDFFKAVASDAQIECESSGGKTKIVSLLNKEENRDICIVADGAAIGAEMDALYKIANENNNIKLFLPESFEWIILKSGLLEDKELKRILENPEIYIDSKEYFSWERYFTRLLIEKSSGTYFKYQKSTLNPVYLHEKNRNLLLNSMEGMDIGRRNQCL